MILKNIEGADEAQENVVNGYDLSDCVIKANMELNKITPFKGNFTTVDNKMIEREIVDVEKLIDPEKIIGFVLREWPQGAQHVMFGLCFGLYGFETNPAILFELAERNIYKCRTMVIAGISTGSFGFEMNPELAKEYKKKWMID